MYEVVSVEPDTRLWEFKGNHFESFYCVFKDEQGQLKKAEWARKVGSHPQVGDKVVGRFEETSFGLKFKMDWEGTKRLRDQVKAEGFQQQYQQQSVIPQQAPPIQAGPTTPAGQTAKDAAIARMAAQKVAVGFVQAQAAAGQSQGQLTPEYVRQLTDFFEQDARR